MPQAYKLTTIHNSFPQMKWVALSLMSLTVALSGTQANRVLFLAPLASKSHTNFFLGIAKALVDNGDEVSIYIYNT